MQKFFELKFYNYNIGYDYYCYKLCYRNSTSEISLNSTTVTIKHLLKFRQYFAFLPGSEFMIHSRNVNTSSQFRRQFLSKFFLKFIYQLKTCVMDGLFCITFLFTSSHYRSIFGFRFRY